MTLKEHWRIDKMLRQLKKSNEWLSEIELCRGLLESDAASDREYISYLLAEALKIDRKSFDRDTNGRYHSNKHTIRILRSGGYTILFFANWFKAWYPAIAIALTLTSITINIRGCIVGATERESQRHKIKSLEERLLQLQDTVRH